MTCDDIREKLKPFLENLLKEEKYQDFLEHLELCSSGFRITEVTTRNQLKNEEKIPQCIVIM